MTAEEYMEKTYGDQLGLFIRNDMMGAMVEYARYHVKKALEVASKTNPLTQSGYEALQEYVDNGLDMNKILNCYPLENIK